jgi:ketosteroid isomerase-like protein
MTTVSGSPGRQFQEDQVRYFETRDLEGIRSHYAEDAAMVTFDTQVFGRDAIVDYFAGFLDRTPGLKLKSTDKLVETEDTLFYEATITFDAGEAHVYDAFVLRDGRAVRHFSGFISFTPNASAG